MLLCCYCCHNDWYISTMTNGVNEGPFLACVIDHASFSLRRQWVTIEPKAWRWNARVPVREGFKNAYPNYGRGQSMHDDTRAALKKYNTRWSCALCQVLSFFLSRRHSLFFDSLSTIGSWHLPSNSEAALLNMSTLSSPSPHRKAHTHQNVFYVSASWLANRPYEG